MKKDKIIVIGVGAGSEAAKIALKKLEDMGHEIVFVDSHEDAVKHVIGTTVSADDIIKAFEDVPRENKPRPLSEILKEEPKPFVLHNHRPLESLKPYIVEENHGPIGAIFGNKKKRRK